MPQVEVKAANQLERRLRRIGPSEAVRRFLGCYGKVRVRSVYALHLDLYFRWLREGRGVVLGPDELVVDNLRCIFRSEPEDVAAKRRHRAWLEEYVNEAMRGRSESHRRLAVSAVKGFYERNDSPLYGKVTIAEQPPTVPGRTPSSGDIRRVLQALPLQERAPLVCEWQSGVEINRVLGLRWREVEKGLERGDCPLRLDFLGRKGHRRSYCTFLGRDSVEHLKLARDRWREVMGADPRPDDMVFLGKRKTGMDHGWLNKQLKVAAARLSRQGLIEAGDPASWHTHMLRHSFKSEAEHARVPSGLVEFMMGHNSGIGWVYDNRDQVHQEDFVEAYRKLEPYVSLDYGEARAREEAEGNERAMMELIRDLQRQVAEMKSPRRAS